jgi:hypothetical protein
VSDDIETRYRGGSAVGRDERGEDVDERRLAGAVRAEQADDLAGPNLEVDAVEHRVLSERLGDPGDVDHGGPFSVVTVYGTYCVCHRH